MNEQTINQQYTRILLLINQRRLKEAIYQLESYLWQCSDWNLRNRFEEMQVAYNYMLQYMQEGIADPGRKSLYIKIQTQALEITDQARLLLLDSHSDHLYHIYRKKQASESTHRDMDQIRHILESFNDDLAVSCLLTEQKQDEVLTRHEDTLKLLFLQTWTNSVWGSAEAEQAKAMLESELLLESDLCLFVSAVTMSLLECFDVRKLLWLMDAYQHSNTQIGQRGLIGMAFAFHRYSDRLHLYPAIENRIASVNEVKQLDKDLMLIQRQILLSQETEKIDKKMREEIIPEMIKNVSSIRNMKFGFEESDEEKDDRNPDWTSMLDEPKLGEKLREMNELQMEGADVNMSTFSALKSFPFFREIQNWFYPFDKKHSSIIKQSKEQNDQNDLLDTIIQSGLFCNNDKYSLFFIMQSFPKAQRDMVFSQLTEQQAEAFSDQAKWEELRKFNDRPTTVSNQYLHDLYRFYKLNQRRMEFTDIFKEKIALYQVPLLKGMLYHPDFLIHLAHYHLSKEHWNEAVELYQQVLTMKECPEATDEFYQRMGYALQKLGRRQEAIAAYLKADTIKPDNVWTNRHLATCYRLTGHFTEALIYYRRVELTTPDNKNIVFYMAHCLAELKQYDEALNYFFKLDFLENNSIKAWRGISWCSFVKGKHEQATRYYEKIIERKPLPVDYLNAGHVYWVSKQTSKAIAMYSKAAELGEGRDAFIEAFKKDAPFLLEQGIAEEDIPLMLDLI
ncbi:MAG: tetratricopeptide repeat protein [Bacteroides sp.]|uniref:tetratricopeptide repeat protein n=1 Tax=Bacteroides sp. TaxID=29523 RepID=UPI002FCBEEDC